MRRKKEEEIVVVVVVVIAPAFSDCACVFHILGAGRRLALET